MTAATVFNAATDLVDRHLAEGRGDKPAIIDGRRAMTYRELADDTARMANLCAGFGLPRESRVALLLVDTCDFPIAFFGAIKAGLVPVALNTLLTPEHYDYMLKDCRARMLVVSPELLATVQTLLAGLPDLTHVIVAGGEAPPYGFALATELVRQPSTFKAIETHRDETAFWLYSSGSTGAPKGTRHAHTSMIETARTYGRHVLEIREHDVCFSAAKLFFAYGLGNSLSFPMSVGATTVLLGERPTPDSIFRIMKQHQPTIFFGVPTLYAAMLANPGCTPVNGSQSLRVCISAGEALPEGVAKSWKNRFGLEIFDGIGSTEMLHIYVSNRSGVLKYGTTGKPVPGYEIRIVDENGDDVADGEVGEMLIKGSTAADGYWNQREKTRATFQGPWTRSGDKYIRDADGYFICQGRADDMFKVSGIWVSPFEVEAALISHEAVLEAGVVAAEDDDKLVKPKAFVALKPGLTGSDALTEELQAHVKVKAGPWKYPRWITYVDALPKTATGKIQRFKLRGQ